MRKKKILVIDDDLDILDALKMTLEDAGYWVMASSNARLLESQVSWKPDLIILDVLLSGRDGRVVAKQLKSIKSSANTPIILTSAHPGVFTNDGGGLWDDFLSKPFDIELLTLKIEKLTSSKLKS